MTSPVNDPSSLDRASASVFIDLLLQTCISAEPVVVLERDLLTVELPGGAISLKVSMVNIHRREAQAYLDAGEPVPISVLQDIAKWEKAHVGATE